MNEIKDNEINTLQGEYFKLCLPDSELNKIWLNNEDIIKLNTSMVELIL